MTDYIELGPVPCDENCTPTKPGTDYEPGQMREMRAYKNQLQRMFPDAIFRLKRFPHDFGSYGEVCVVYVPGTESEERAYHVEANLPRSWDEEALAELDGWPPAPRDPAGDRLGLDAGQI